MGNVIEFPRFYQGPPKSPEDGKENLEIIRENYIEEVLEYIESVLFQQLAQAGFPVDIDFLNKDVCLVHESLRALMMHYYNIEHPLQQFSDVIFNNNNRVVICQLDKEGNQVEPNIEIVTQEG